MYNDSRKAIYDYLYDMLYNAVSKNVYDMFKPLELTNDDTTNGFVVTNVGEFNDASEFHCQTYGWARCYVTAYIPLMSRGRVDSELYGEFEANINRVINEGIQAINPHFTIIEDSIISMDDIDDENPNNQFATFTKSFVVTVDGDNQINSN